MNNQGKIKSVVIRLKNLSKTEIADIQRNINKKDEPNKFHRITRAMSRSISMDGASSAKIYIMQKDKTVQKKSGGSERTKDPKRHENESASSALNANSTKTAKRKISPLKRSTKKAKLAVTDVDETKTAKLAPLFRLQNQKPPSSDSKRANEEKSIIPKRQQTHQSDDMKHDQKGVKKGTKPNTLSQLDRTPISLAVKQTKSAAYGAKSIKTPDLTSYFRLEIRKPTSSNDKLANEEKSVDLNAQTSNEKIKNQKTDDMKHDKREETEVNKLPQLNVAGVSFDVKPEEVLTIAPIVFQIGEVVWAKIKGSAHWPAKIKSFPSSKMVIVVWFNDYRTTKIYRTQVFKFLIHFDTFAKSFDRVVGLKKAAQEGLIYYGSMIGRSD